MKLFTAVVSYETDIFLDPDNPTRLEDNIVALGGRNVTVELTPWTGKGDHIWVGVNMPGLEERKICVKCTQTQASATPECPGIAA